MAGTSRIIDTGEVFSRLFALGLDTLEIARVFDVREGGVCEALEAHALLRASDVHKHPPQHPRLDGSAAQ